MDGTAERSSHGESLSIAARAIARGLRRPTLSPRKIGALAALVDFAALGIGLWFSAYAASGAGFDGPRVTTETILAAASILGLLAALGEYRLARLRRFWSGGAALLGLGLLCAATQGTPLGSSLILVALVVPAHGFAAGLAAAALDYGLTERRALIIGGGERASVLMRALADNPENDIRICGIFDDRDDIRSPLVVDGVQKLGRLDSLVAFAREAEIDMLIITLPLTAEARIRGVLKAVEVLPVDVRLSDFSTDPNFRRRSGALSQGRLIDVISRPLREGELALKRAVDIAGALVGIAVLSPVLIATAIAVRLDSPGPILFRQARHGYNHRPVNVWKFRSMYIESCDPTARQIVTKGDPRVTRVGRFIRRSSIDELPQLFNVLTGDLSLVGPRPHAVSAVSSRQQAFEAIVEGYAARHKVRPGITGWAQINGWRGEIDDPTALRQRVEHDLHYIENWSIWMDLYILFITPFKLLDTSHAY